MNSTKKLTEGAMMVAIIGVLLFINRQSAGFIDFILYWVVPLPIIIYTVKYGFKDAVVVAISSVILAIVTGMPTGMYYTIVGAILGLAYGNLVRKNKDTTTLLLTSCIISIISNFVTMIVFAALFGYGDLAQQVVELQTILNESFEKVNSSLPADQQLMIAESMYSFLPKLIIMTTALTGVIEGVLVHLLSYIVLTRFKIKIQKMRPLNTIRLPRVGGYLIFLAYLMSGYFLGNNIYNISTDILYTVQILSLLTLIVNGYLCVATILAFYRKKKLSILLILFVFPPFNFILAMLGFLDSIQNIRDKETILKKQ